MLFSLFSYNCQTTAPVSACVNTTFTSTWMYYEFWRSVKANNWVLPVCCRDTVSYFFLSWVVSFYFENFSPENVVSRVVISCLPWHKAALSTDLNIISVHCPLVITVANFNSVLILIQGEYKLQISVQLLLSRLQLYINGVELPTVTWLLIIIKCKELYTLWT